MIGNVMAMAISMMTEGDFWDKFQKKHNPQFYDLPHFCHICDIYATLCDLFIT